MIRLLVPAEGLPRTSNWSGHRRPGPRGRAAALDAMPLTLGQAVVSLGLAESRAASVSGRAHYFLDRDPALGAEFGGAQCLPVEVDEGPAAASVRYGSVGRA